MDNPGRYLTLLTPINSASAYTGTPYFTGNPGDPFKAWDVSATFDYMPKQYITFRWEYGSRHANVPYWTGRGGITPPGGNTGGRDGTGTDKSTSGDHRVLRIRPHTELRNVESFLLYHRGDSHGLYFVHYREYDKRCSESPYGAERSSPELN